MIVYDFEVFRYDWLVVFKDLDTGQYTRIVNDREKLTDYHKQNQDELFIGFNNSRYDNYIFKTILLGKDPYYTSHIIIDEKRSNRIYRLADWNSININSYDVSFGLGFTSLKENEAYLGISIDECPVDFNHPTPLDSEEIELVFDYCMRDVDATELLFYESQDAFQTKLYLLNEFKLDKSYLTKSSLKIIESVLGADRKYICTDEFDPFDFTQLDLRIDKYQDLIEHYEQPISSDYKSLSFDREIAGVPHSFGIGGVHGAISNFEYDGRLLIIDVASYYPSMMIEYDWFARSIPEEYKKKYAQMKKDRSVLKKTNKGLSNAYKLVLNTTYGCYKYKWGTLYDPRMANNICIGGQVMLVDLIEQLEPYCKLVQSNTDGIIIIPNEDSEDLIMQKVQEWESRTRLEMEVSVGNRIVQKDVNNYVFRLESGQIKAVGGYVKQYSGRGLRRTMAIVDKALVQHLMFGTEIEQFIQENDNPLDFQIISKVGKTYDKVFIEYGHGELVETNFVNRAFASHEPCRLYKQKTGKNKELVANHPENTLLWNDSLDDFDMANVDKSWYIDKAYSRLRDYLKG